MRRSGEDLPPLLSVSTLPPPLLLIPISPPGECARAPVDVSHVVVLRIHGTVDYCVFRWRSHWYARVIDREDREGGK